MTSDYDSLAQDFLTGLAPEERTKLYNDLLALEVVHKLNQHSTYYTFKNLKRAAHRHSERRKRTFRYMNSFNNELIIHQIHEQHFFKNKYCIHVYFNSQEYNYLFIERLLSKLKSPVSAPMRTFQEITV
ncbi:hypothetical protein A5819_002676 [Enterococcus sp. 7E2_DIV0204]|uniref:Uncharacterized protein n=1 Tax=Candidatus Enterococcus lemimoniae TaxID=1834167 RepID=A0ABZ2T2V1_9ENTE|nr:MULTISPECIES: hypothetical protein [unclassified Enterococcus]OTN90177.1 hypothetical protein A5819_002676 [Enterococcus sp. 7E2_DIV0204]OTO69034.1 hypothetical protein A5866_001233 [Enterococcus sp. 12C11_DIV0727]OTP52633.1 hypothetical protein A5884_001835 [Enterococcus sp. 7D2_DIV0200]